MVVVTMGNTSGNIVIFQNEEIFFYLDELDRITHA